MFFVFYCCLFQQVEELGIAWEFQDLQSPYWLCLELL